MMKASMRVQLLLMALSLAGCSGNTDSDLHERPAQYRIADENKWMFAAVQKADQLILFEGLPHPAWESELLAEERQKKETVTLHDFSFYAAPLNMPAEDKDKLRGLLGDERFYLPWQGEAMCGGFHPDYLAEWRIGDAACQFQICFGCGEVEVFGPDKNLRYHMSGKGEKHLAELLRKHRKHRPPRSTKVSASN